MKYLLLFCIFSYSLFSQDDELDKLPFDDEPIQETNTNYFAIGGGYTIGLYSLDLEDFNLMLKNQFGRNELSKSLIMHGGIGFTGIPFIKNFRVGVHSFAGNLSNQSSEGDFLKIEELRLSLTGMNFDYGYVVFENIAILGGLGLGWGQLDFDITQANKNYNWDEISNIPDENNYYIFAEKNFMYLSPSLSVEWAATSFLMFRALAKYNLAFNNPLASQDDNSWQVNKVSTLNNVPENLSTSGLYFEFGIFFGLFNY